MAVYEMYEVIHINSGVLATAEGCVRKAIDAKDQKTAIRMK